MPSMSVCKPEPIEIETSSLDQRSYRLRTLSNGLEMFLVHDAKTDKASASMDINVRYMSDPEKFPGLAHFIEHVLHMGTKKVSWSTSLISQD